MCLCHVDFSRRRPKKNSTPRSKDSTPRGFTPRTQVPTSTQRRDRKKNEEKESPDISSPKEIGSFNTGTSQSKEQVSDVNLEAESEEESDDESAGFGIEVVSKRGPFLDNKIRQLEENGRIPEVDDSFMESKDTERISKIEVSSDAGIL